MAPSQSQTNHSDQPHHPSSYTAAKTIFRCGNSKSQICLQKILHTILTIPSHSSSPSNSSCSLVENGIQNKNEDVPPPKTDDPQSPPAADEQENIRVVEEINTKRGDCMGLLIEAAKMIFGEIKEGEEKLQSFDDFKDDSTRDTRAREKTAVNKQRNKRCTEDLYGDTELEPVVRSKRGRTQVLPCKYRDSVLEPLTRAPRNRSTIISPSKRRLR